jgi:hypothetical protein
VSAGGIVLAGRQVLVPGVECVSWLDDATRYPRAPKVYRHRKTPPQFIVAHAVVGNLGPLMPGAGPSGRGERYAKYQATTTRAVSWDGTVECGGRVVWHNDSADNATWQAGHANARSLGIELEQEPDGTQYAAQMPAFVALVEALCAHFGIPRHVSARNGAPCLAYVPQLSTAAGVANLRGVVFHCNLTRNRGPGDPGPHAGEALLAAGFAPVDFGAAT